MGAIGVSSSIATQRAPPWSRRVQLPHLCLFKPQTFVGYRQKLHAPPKLRCSLKRKLSTTRIKRLEFGAVELRLFNSDNGRLGFVSSRYMAIRAQKEDDEKQEVDKVESKSSESWTSSFQRANMVSRIFAATFVWMSLFFGISVANNERGGGRSGRQGPRK